MFPRSFSSSSSEKREKTTDFERAETKRIKKMFGRKMVEGGGGESRRGECLKENKAGAAKRRIRGRKKSGTR